MIKYIFIFLAIALLITLTSLYWGTWSIEDEKLQDEIELQLQRKALDYKKLPLLDESKVTKYIGEGESGGIPQGFYKAKGNTGYDNTDYFTYGDEDRGYYSYVIIGDSKYDLGWVTYEGNDDKEYLLRTYGIKNTDIKLETPIYKVQRLFGLSAPTTTYLTTYNDVPYIIFDTPGWSEEYDLDGDGLMETVTNTGTGTWQDYMIYSWLPEDKVVLHARPTDVLDCDVVTYLADKNLFAAYTYNRDTGKFGSETMYQYKNGYLVNIK